MDRIYVAGCPVDRTTLGQLTDRLCDAVSTRQRCQVLGVNAAFVVSAAKDSHHRHILETTTYVPVDGFWVAVAARLLGYHGVLSVGIERLVYRLLPRLASINGTVYLLGAAEQIVQRTACEIEERYRGIKVVGTRNGYFAETDEEDILADINAKAPDLVLLGMASPKKEIWILKYRDRVKASVIIGVGGLFDVIAGKIPPAPDWMKDHGLEWFFRLIHDPRRLWKRYTIGNSHFLLLVLKDWILRKTYGKGTVSSGT
jgi:N-acetylglucosaminyldiphosphoundecaprenol N-acetyl-beta-D-mannosaminyltransferase